jgi:hypothetical protein
MQNCNRASCIFEENVSSLPLPCEILLILPDSPPTSVFLLFLAYFMTLFRSETILCWMVGWRIGKDLEGSPVTNPRTITAFAWRDWWKPLEISVKMAAVRAEIQSEHLPHASLDHTVRHAFCALHFPTTKNSKATEGQPPSPNLNCRNTIKHCFKSHHRSDGCFCCRRMCFGWPISFPTLSATSWFHLHRSVISVFCGLPT